MNFKKGLEYRPINCYFDDKLKILINKFGLRGYAILQLITNKIYFENGYYLKWDDDIQALFTVEINAKDNKIVGQCLEYLLERGFFDKEMYEKYSILTSIEIQQEYAKITYKRVNQWHTPQYVYSSILSAQTDIRLTENDSNLGEKDNGNNTEKRTAKENESKAKESESKCDSLTPAQSLSQRLNKQLKNKNLQIDTNVINVDSLCSAVLESDFLQKASNLNVDWLVKHYADIIAGKYRNAGEIKKQTNSATLHHRQYTKEELDGAFGNLDDFIQ